MAGVKQFDESAFLEKALDIFRRKGLAATTMQDLAEATGVQRGSLYNAYGHKDAIFLRVFAIYWQRFLAGATQALAASSPRDAIAAFLETAIANMCGEEEACGCLTTRTA